MRAARPRRDAAPMVGKRVGAAAPHQSLNRPGARAAPRPGRAPSIA